MALGSIIGAAMNGIGAIFGGVNASKAMKEARNNIQRQLRENQDWYDRRYNEDATQRADAQRLLTMTEDSIRRRNKAAAGAAAVMGGTEEGVAAAKAANNTALADATSQIAAAGEQRKDSIEQTYLARKDGLQEQLRQLEQAKAGNISKAIQGVSGAAAGIADGLSGLDGFWKKKSNTSPAIPPIASQASTSGIPDQN